MQVQFHVFTLFKALLPIALSFACACYADDLSKGIATNFIRVGLITDVNTAYLLHGKDTITVHAEGNSLRTSDQKKQHKTQSLFLKPNSNLSASVSKKFQNRYKGSVKVSAKNGKLTIVNEIDIEEYLQGVVPYEIGTLDLTRYNALKAQAVAARTYAYKHLKSRESLGFDVYADTRDQVYNGTTGSTSLTNKAITETAHEIIVYNNSPIEAYYHSTCAGRTATLAVWGKSNVPYLSSISDTDSGGNIYCKASSYMTWEKKLNAKTLPSLIESNSKAANAKNYKPFKKILNIVIESTFEDGRVSLLSVMTDKGTFTVKGDKTRWLFAENGKILPSASFTIKRKGNEWIILGHGFGHGIGMCQMGARERAKAGQTYKEILEHYYPGAKVEAW